MNSKSSIVDRFKKHARELSYLYKARRKLEQAVKEHEAKLRDLGEILEFADNIENSYKELEAPAK